MPSSQSETAITRSTVSAASGPPTLLFAVATGVIVVNLFAPQTLIGLIGRSMGLDPKLGGLVAMAALLGYAAGLFLLVPLADLVENRELVLRLLALAVLAAGGAAAAPGAPSLLVLLFVLGAACSAIQILVPLAASMAPPEKRGRVIGDVMGGLLAGIVLARPAASLVAEAWGWRVFYGASAAAMALLATVLASRLPRLRPRARSGYSALIASLWSLLRAEPVLRRRALTAGLVMAAFSLFWTSVALRLPLAPFGLGQRGIALFALAGAGGALATPLFGRAGDRGWTRGMTTASHCILIGALALAAWAGAAGAGAAGAGDMPDILAPLPALLLMGLGALLLDIGVTGDQTLGRRAINLLRPEARGRINGLFVGLFFLGGAVGSAMAGFVWAWGGWTAVCAAAAGFAVAALFLGRLGEPA